MAPAPADIILMLVLCACAPPCSPATTRQHGSTADAQQRGGRPLRRRHAPHGRGAVSSAGIDKSRGAGALDPGHMPLALALAAAEVPIARRLCPGCALDARLSLLSRPCALPCCRPTGPPVLGSIAAPLTLADVR